MKRPKMWAYTYAKINGKLAAICYGCGMKNKGKDWGRKPTGEQVYELCEKQKWQCAKCGGSFSWRRFVREDTAKSRKKS